MEALFTILVIMLAIWLFWPKSLKKRSAPRRVYGYVAPASRVSGPNLPAMPPDLILEGRVHVIDGDTIKIRGTKIRLAGIDAPEINMPWGQKSKWAMVGICKGQIVTARLDGERSFDRLVGTCFLPDGRDIGAELVKTGLALDLPHFSGGKYRGFEPEGARRRLGYGKFGHRSIKITQRTEIQIETRRR